MNITNDQRTIKHERYTRITNAQKINFVSVYRTDVIY